MEPLHLEFDVACPAEHAFEVWTASTSLWWPATHSVSQADGLLVTIEPRLGGRIFERTPGGAEHDWGEVTLWEPPRRLGYAWHIGQDRSTATDVVIVFSPRGTARCRITVEHRGWERLGSEAPARRQANQAGWSGLIPHFVEAAESSV